MIDEINTEREKSDRLTVAKLNAVKQFNKQDHKSKLMTEKYSLLPLNPQQLTPVNLLTPYDPQRPNIHKRPRHWYQLILLCQLFVNTFLDKIVKNIETQVIHSLELPIQAQDLVKAYQHSTRFHDIYQYIIDGKLPSSTKAQNCIRAEALNYIIINHFLLRIDT